MTRKLELKVSIALFAAFALTLFYTKTAQASTNAAIYSTTNATLKLNYNSYIYNQNGKRVPWFIGYYGKQTYLKKGSTIYTNRMIEPTNRDVRYYLRFSNVYHTNESGEKYWLPYQKINGDYFYYIGYGAYIKARNVRWINNILQYSNGEKVRVKAKIASIVAFDQENKTTFIQKNVKKGTVLTIDGYRQFFDDDSPDFNDADQPILAHVKGNDDLYIDMGDLNDKDLSVCYIAAEDMPKNKVLYPRVNLIFINSQERFSN